MWVTDGLPQGCCGGSTSGPPAGHPGAHDRRRRQARFTSLTGRARSGSATYVSGTVFARRPAHGPRHRARVPRRRRPVIGGRRRRRLGPRHRGRDPDRDRYRRRRAARARVGRPHAGRADGVRPDAAGPVQRLGPRADVDAIRLVLQQHGYRAGRFNVGSPVVRRVDDPDRQLRPAPLRRQRQRLRAHDTSLVALVGPWSSFCAETALRTLNLAEGGPVPVISPSSTDAGLTRTDGLRPSPRAQTAASPASTTRPACATSCACPRSTPSRSGTALAVLAKSSSGSRTVYVLLDCRHPPQGGGDRAVQAGPREGASASGWPARPRFQDGNRGRRGALADAVAPPPHADAPS